MQYNVIGIVSQCFAEKWNNMWKLVKKNNNLSITIRKTGFKPSVVFLLHSKINGTTVPVRETNPLSYLVKSIL